MAMHAVEATHQITLTVLRSTVQLTVYPIHSALKLASTGRQTGEGPKKSQPFFCCSLYTGTPDE